MQADEALTIVQNALNEVLDDPVEITAETDLIGEEILDSLDGMVFMMEIENASGKKLPEDIDLVDEGYYKVEKLVAFLTAA